MVPKISPFVLLVRDMREAQKTYFATRSSEALRRSKEIEKQVDSMLKEAFSRVQQGKLI